MRPAPTRPDALAEVGVGYRGRRVLAGICWIVFARPSRSVFHLCAHGWVGCAEGGEYCVIYAEWGLRACIIFVIGYR